MPAGSYIGARRPGRRRSGKVIARAEVPFEREVEVAILKPTGDCRRPPTARRRRRDAGDGDGDHQARRQLWRIARSAWGKGIRWSTIYQANTDQIRDPHWIYPGQVFVMPKGDTDLAELSRAAPAAAGLS